MSTAAPTRPSPVAAAAEESAMDPRSLRDVLGHFCTGVAVITTLENDVPVGFACQSFASLSLDPPLILFCPGRSSRAWAAIERVGRFTVNLLSQEQQEVSATFGRRGEDKFARVRWSASPSGTPVLKDALAWIDCEVADVLEGGDHHIVTGRVTALKARPDVSPLLFFRGSYAGLSAAAHRSEPRYPVPAHRFSPYDTWF